jgi:hypothetical protein
MIESKGTFRGEDGLTMSIADIIPEVLALSRGEKFQLAQLLLEDLASQEPTFVEGAVYPIRTPAYAPAAAAQLAQVLSQENGGA